MRFAKKIAAVLLASLCITAVAGVVGVEANSSSVIRVGLAYGSNAADNVVLKSEYGFVFGCSEGRSFKAEASTDVQCIVAAPAIGKSDSGLSETMITLSAGFVGGMYHVQLPSVYMHYSSAKKALTDGFIAMEDGYFAIRIGSYETYAEAAVAAKKISGAFVSTPDNDTVTVYNALTGKPIYEYDGSAPLTVSPASGRVSVGLSGKAYDYDGFIELATKDNLLRVVNCVELEDYVKGVMSSEIGSNESDEITKAFSVMIRTVPLQEKHVNDGYDVCCASCCQNYRGHYLRNARLDAIADSTAGQVITYKNTPIICLYHNSNGGQSCSSSDAWGGNGLPYLVSVTLDEGESVDTWVREFSESNLNAILAKKKYGLSGSIESVAVTGTASDGSGFVTELTVADSAGNTYTETTAARVRDLLGLESANFKAEYVSEVTVLTANGVLTEATSVITEDGVKQFSGFDDGYTVLNADGSKSTVSPSTLRISGTGRGHCVGFSLAGAHTLEKQGFDYAEMIKFYFPGTAITASDDKLFA